jgi:hypothetical protein
MKPWDENLMLFTPEEFEKIPDGTELTCIDDTTAIKGQDEIDLDTRFGHIAYGVRDPWTHPLKDLFLLFKIAEKA